MRTFEWAIEDVVAAYPELALEDDAAMVVAITKHLLPCEFLVEINGFQFADFDDSEFMLRLTWNEETAARAERVQRTRQRTPIVEGAAVALGFLLISHLVPNSGVEVVLRGEGPDYWLPTLHQALEFTGTERRRNVPRRRREKRGQLLGNWRGWDGYVILCCFADSERVIQWHHHSQPR